MTVLLAVLILLAVLVALVAAVLIALVAPHLTTRRAQRVVVNLRTGESLVGREVSRFGAHITLAEVQLHEAGEVNRLDGQVVIEKATITFRQVLPPVAPDTAAS